MYTIFLFDPAQVNQALFLGAVFRRGESGLKKKILLINLMPSFFLHLLSAYITSYY